MAKKDIIAELEALGVTENESKVEGVEKLTGTETVPQLEEILAKAKTIVVPANSSEDDGKESGADAAKEDESAPTTAPENEAKVKPSKVDYGDSVDILSGKNFIRYYSVENHGENFLDLAKELIGKPEYASRNYEIKPSSETPRVEVRYREKEDAEKHLDEQSPDSPMMDKSRRFEDRDEALAFSVQKHGSIVVLTK